MQYSFGQVGHLDARSCVVRIARSRRAVFVGVCCMGSISSAHVQVDLWWAGGMAEIDSCDTSVLATD